MSKISDLTEALRPDKREGSLLVLFIPSVDRWENPIDQDLWKRNALAFVGENLGGGTAYPRGDGVWRDDKRGGVLVFDNPVIIQVYINIEKIIEKSRQLRDFLHRMGRETHQGAVGYVIDNQYFEIDFPLEEKEEGS